MMTDAWSKFWIAMAVMALSGALVVNASAGDPVQMGPLGQWAAALATVSAVLVALFNTNKTLSETARKAEEQKIHDEWIYTSSIYKLCIQVELAIDLLTTHICAPTPTPIANIKLAKDISHIGGLVGAIDRIPIHVAHDPDLISALVNIRMSALNTSTKLDRAVEAGLPAIMSFGPERRLIVNTKKSLENDYPELA
jgi:hypothetical protein